MHHLLNRPVRLMVARTDGKKSQDHAVLVHRDAPAGPFADAAQDAAVSIVGMAGRDLRCCEVADDGLVRPSFAR